MIIQQIIDRVLTPLGFRKTGKTWMLDMGEIIQVVELQKSAYGHMFYINYGYIIKDLPLDKLKMHVFNRVGSMDVTINRKIGELLNLENDTTEKERGEELKNVLDEILVAQFNRVKNLADLKVLVGQYENLNSIPVVVKNYLDLN